MTTTTLHVYETPATDPAISLPPLPVKPHASQAEAVSYYARFILNVLRDGGHSEDNIRKECLSPYTGDDSRFEEEQIATFGKIQAPARLVRNKLINILSASPEDAQPLRDDDKDPVGGVFPLTSFTDGGFLWAVPNRTCMVCGDRDIDDACDIYVIFGGDFPYSGFLHHQPECVSAFLASPEFRDMLENGFAVDLPEVRPRVRAFLDHDEVSTRVVATSVVHRHVVED